MFKLCIPIVFILSSFISYSQTFINDTSFRANLSATTGTRGVYTLVPLSMGRLLVGGTFNSYNTIAASHCVLTDTSGVFIRNFPVNNTVYKADTTADGYIIIAGAFTSYNGNTQNRIVKIDTLGNLASGWQNAGINAAIRDFKIQPDGKIIIAGEFSALDSFSRVARLNPDGSIDTSYKTWPGIQLTTGPPFAMQVALQSGGKAVVSGYFNQYSGNLANGIVRLHADGSYDHSFLTGTGAQVASNPASVNAMAVRGDTLYLGGNFTSFNGTPVGRMVRLFPNGATDSTFAMAIGITGFSSTVAAIHLLADNRMLVGGAFTSYKGVSQRRLCLLNNGYVDYNFVNTGTTYGVNPSGAVVNVIGVNNKGEAYIGITTGGGYPTFNNVTSNHLIRLSNGSSYLPVKWLSIGILPSSSGHIISWCTASELHNDYFIIERAETDKPFVPIARVKAAGNSHRVTNYSHAIPAPNTKNQTLYYRIKQVDADGSVSYSETVACTNSKETRAFSVSPNPASSSVITISGKHGSEIRITDGLGYEIPAGQIPIDGQLELLLPPTLRKGIYFIHNTQTGEYLKFIKD